MADVDGSGLKDITVNFEMFPYDYNDIITPLRLTNALNKVKMENESTAYNFRIRAAGDVIGSVIDGKYTSESPQQ